jgi:sec-independent protein translocase protein TatC
MLEEIKPHLRDLRKRLGYALATIFVMFLAAFSFWEPIMAWMNAPMYAALPEGAQMVFLSPTEPIFTALKVSFFAALLISLPMIFWQLWLFIAPGLYANEKALILPFVIFATIMFLIGAAFCYYVVIPLGLEFIVNFGGQLFTAMISIGMYVGFFVKIHFGFGLAFELPVITYFLAKIGLVTDRSLSDFFKYAIVIIFLLAALLTPPDVLTQFLMAGPLIILYGVSILIAKAVNPAPKEDEEEDEEDEDEDNEEKESDDDKKKKKKEVDDDGWDTWEDAEKDIDDDDYDVWQ